ncbi:MAG: FAD-dependent oxidoreductase, partial [Gammaproteobacteria bacterium]|nr:FAD-dependent oxidoreductase [Gammaproteobacteria bacterium]
FSAFDQSIPKARIDNLFAMLERIFPDYEKAVDRGKARAWAGLRPMSADGTPFIGQTAVENLYVNAGHGQIGWSTGPGSARLLADIVAGTGPDLDPADYNPGRS